MRTPRRHLECLLLGTLALVWGAVGAAACRAEESWLSAAVRGELRRGESGKGRQELEKRLEAVAMARLACGRLEAGEELADLVGALRACRWLTQIETDAAGRKLGAWLLDHRDVSRRLFRALDDVRSPQAALRRFAELHAADPNAVAAWANLAVATATAEEMRHYRKPPRTAALVEGFRYFTDPKRVFRYDLKKMPYELSRYVVDTPLAVEERQWAAARYLRLADPGAAYFHVKYDFASYLQGSPKQMVGKDYTLANLLQYGGVCIDQAYYCVQVCKSIGIPAAIVTGRGSSGIGHAWVMYFQMNPAGTSAAWLGGAGRYASHQYFVGAVRDPASGQYILDSQLILTGAAALLPLRRREEAEAYAALAELADRLRDKAGEAGVEPLVALAESYRKAAAAAGGAQPKVALDAIRKQAEPDAACVEELLALSVKRNLACDDAWKLLIRLRKAERLPAKALGRFFDVLVQKTAAEWPEYSCYMILQIVPTLADAKARQNAYRRSLEVYGARADLRGKVLLALGDDCLAADDKAGALKAYQLAAASCLNVPGVVVPAAEKAEKLLADDDKSTKAIAMYQQLWARTARTSSNPEVRRQTSHYRLGQRLAELLKRSGNAAAAEQVLRGL